MNNIYLYWVGYEYKLIKILRDLIYLHSKNSYNVHLITKENLKEYVTELPSYFNELLPAHQADYIRVFVVCDRGGIWLDSDILVMDNLSSLFKLFETNDGFFITENGGLCNGLFGSKPNTEIMLEWKKQLKIVLDNKNGKINWWEVGGTMITNIYNNLKDKYNYKIFNGLENMYPIPWQTIYQEIMEKPYDNYTKLIRNYQPLIILLNSIYKKYETMNENEIKNNLLTFFINKSNVNYEKQIQNSYESYFDIANKNYTSERFEDAIFNYKKVLEISKLNDEKYIACYKIYESYSKLNKEKEGLLYLVESLQYDRQRIECVYGLFRYYRSCNMYEISYGFYTIIKDYYENEFIKDYHNLLKKIDFKLENYTFYFPYFMIILAHRINKKQTVMKMFEIIFEFKYFPNDSWYLNNFLHNLSIYINVIKEKNPIKCKEYLNLLFDVPNINKDSLNNLLSIVL